MSPNLFPYEFALAHARASAEARQLKSVADETRLGYSWLEKFARGKIPNAGNLRVTRLVNHYREKPAMPALVLDPPSVSEARS